jgi:hypothetical protein
MATDVKQRMYQLEHKHSHFEYFIHTRSEYFYFRINSLCETKILFQDE